MNKKLLIDIASRYIKNSGTTVEDLRTCVYFDAGRPEQSLEQYVRIMAEIIPIANIPEFLTDVLKHFKNFEIVTVWKSVIKNMNGLQEFFPEQYEAVMSLDSGPDLTKE